MPDTDLWTVLAAGLNLAIALTRLAAILFKPREPARPDQDERNKRRR